MVEGPGCTLNGEKIRARVLPGQAVTGVRGTALQSLLGPAMSPAASLADVATSVSQSCVLLGSCSGKWSKNTTQVLGSPIYSGSQDLEPVFPDIYLT
jgi:endonuclease VIII-like 3